jgi:hypothetical protein
LACLSPPNERKPVRDGEEDRKTKLEMRRREEDEDKKREIE